jgi:hypothetical protein
MSHWHLADIFNVLLNLVGKDLIEKFCTSKIICPGFQTAILLIAAS